MEKILLSESEKISIVKYGSELGSILKAFFVIGENIDKMKINISVRTIHKAGQMFEENVETETFCSLAMKIYNYIGLLLNEIKSLSPRRLSTRILNMIPSNRFMISVSPSNESI